MRKVLIFLMCCAISAHLKGSILKQTMLALSIQLASPLTRLYPINQRYGSYLFFSSSYYLRYCVKGHHRDCRRNPGCLLQAPSKL
ncbi:hypothetical protein BDN70DRAFT_602964 [Pholiota conissans]|uniref:Secreted protein n=1 Tax=Pholiota conissans TaxID=109636 RepID=A0A9P5Z498_9AGAR|nr:hypothetical protein BDN70DRAFT_602964 [Pholiota conissans]